MDSPKRAYNAELFCWPEQDAEQTVEMPMTWDAMTFMWRHYYVGRRWYVVIVFAGYFAETMKS